MPTESRNQKLKRLKFCRKIRESLFVREERCRDNLRKVRERLREEESAPTDVAEMATRNSIQEMLTQAVDSAEQELSGIRAVRVRFNNRAYGRCENKDCGIEIPLKRLEASPFTRFCVQCQEQAEYLERFPGSNISAMAT